MPTARRKTYRCCWIRSLRSRAPSVGPDLWSALCHQGSVYSASFAALPWLADVAGRDDREQAVSALNLAGAILAGSDQPHGAGDVRAQHAAEVETLLVVVNEHLRTSSDRNEYAYLLESMLSFEGVVSWGEDLAWGLVNEEYEVSCPGCEANLFIVIGERGFFSTSGDYALSEDDVETTPLRPASPAAMDGIGRRLYDIALADRAPRRRQRDDLRLRRCDVPGLRNRLLRSGSGQCRLVRNTLSRSSETQASSSNWALVPQVARF